MGEVYTNINGVNRRVANMYANINGVWRQASAYPNIDGIYRESDKFEITDKEIIGFRFAYVSNHNAKYPDLPNLRYNPNIPAKLSISGVNHNPNNMDLIPKGIVFQFDNTLEPDQLLDDEEEGILLYECRIYAVLANGMIIDVTATSDVVGCEERSSIYSILGTTEVWSTNRLNKCNIVLSAKCDAVVNGINIEAWNKVFNTSNEIGSLSVNNTSDESHIVLNEYKLLPINTRSSKFYPFAEVGVARDLHTVDKNMIGTYGYFTHTYSRITVNGQDKPFVVEIHH